MLKLAWKYMGYYKSQTFAIFTSILLTAALLSGISSLLYSSQKNDLANSKAIYGDWHYRVQADDKLYQAVQNGVQGNGFKLEACGKAAVRREAAGPYGIAFLCADEGYRRMAHRELLEGAYPKNADEVAADRFVLGSLGFTGSSGDTVEIDGHKYKVSGILKSRWAADTDEMEVFVSDSFAGSGNRILLYLRFYEGKKLYKQLDGFQKACGVPSGCIEPNDEVVRYLGGEKPDGILDIIKFGLFHKDGNITYIILKLQSEYNLSYYGMIFLLCLFSLFAVYSVFNISVSRRTSEYGILQAIGISEARIGRTLVLELWMLLLAGYPLGCLLGNGILSIAYEKLSGVFAGGDTASAGVYAAGQAYAQGQGASGFFCSMDAVWAGFVFLLVSFAAVGAAVMRSMKKQSVKEVMGGDVSYTKKRKIYALRDVNLATILIRKFLFSNKKKVLGILLSLSIGGCIFLCTAYMVENLKVHARMSLKSDDGLGSVYRVSLKSASLQDKIPKSAAARIQKLPQLAEAYAVKYTMGELKLAGKEFFADKQWGEYFDYQNKEPYFVQRYGGICVEKENGSYGIKYDVYGYDDGLLGQLKDFVLEGEIDAEKLKSGSQVIAVANIDGQGNYYFYGKKPGERITLRVPKQEGYKDEWLRFHSGEENYIEKQFEIAAIVSRPLAQEEGFLNTRGWLNAQSIIMANDQMEQNFGITDYSFLNASPKEGADTGLVSSRLLGAIQDVPKAVLKDYTAAIRTQMDYLNQQQAFFTGIAAILLLISLFHIANSMNYTIMARRREYGIIRAMGITDAGFYKMILSMGILYGLLADIWIFLIYHLLLRRVMDYYMVHVVQFLHFQAGVPAGVMIGVMVLNIVIAAAAVMVPAVRLARRDLIYEITG